MKRDDAIPPREFQKLSEIEHPYPATRIMWSPATASGTEDELLATSGDYLRLWKVDASGGGTKMKALLNNKRHTGGLNEYLILW